LNFQQINLNLSEKKLIMLAILTLCLLSISTTAAAAISLDNNTNDEIAGINDEISIEENEIGDDAPKFFQQMTKVKNLSFQIPYNHLRHRQWKGIPC
jgi:hypothetical protein